MKEKINIQLHEYSCQCADGCCYNYGTIVIVNGEKLTGNSQDTSTILESVLNHLGYEVDINETYNFE